MEIWEMSPSRFKEEMQSEKLESEITLLFVLSLLIAIAFEVVHYISLVSNSLI